MKSIVWVLAFLLIATTVEAQIYRCTDQDGKVYYSAEPGPNCALLSNSVEQETGTEKPAPEKQVPDKPNYQYKLLRSQNADASGGIKRTVYHIEVPFKTEDKAIESILQQAVEDLKERRVVDALAVHLYLKGTDISYAHADWAPFGEWSKAERGTPYSVYETSIHINSLLRSILKSTNSD